jgi:hypothetical protein
MLFVYVHTSLSSKLVPDCVLFITTTFILSSQHLCTKANTLLARAYQGHDALMPPRFFEIFQKIPTTLSRLIAQAKGFLNGNSNSRKVKMTACAGVDGENPST